MNEARALKALADALERYEAAARYPGVSCPEKIVFHDRLGNKIDFGATLLEAIKQQISLEWDGLRMRTLERIRKDIDKARADLAEVQL